MPSPTHRLTLAKNTHRPTRTILLLSPSTDALTQVLKTSKNKLQIRSKSARIFNLLTGEELTTSTQILSLPVTSTLLISSGESYIGAPVPAAQHQTETYCLATHSHIEDSARAQLSTAANLPGILYGVGQPDLHPGARFPIGAVFVSEGWVHPGLIGSDIGCGMSWYRLTLPASSLHSRGDCKKVADTLLGLEGPWGTVEERREWVGAGIDVGTFESALGTIGGGNHFVEVQHVESGVSESGAEVLLLVHSGSRGFGGDVLGRFYKPDVGLTDGINVSSHPEKAGEYLRLHDTACAWARASRDLIALRFLQRLEPGGEWVGQPSELRRKVAARKWVDIHHNNVVATKWPPGAQETEQKEVFIHRKGAAPTSAEHPILPLPGSRGAPTLILKPVFSALNEFGKKNALSAAHGAGRVMSRTQAAQSLRWKYVEDGGGKKVTPSHGRMHKSGAKEGGDFEVGREAARGGGEKWKKKKENEELESQRLGWMVCDSSELLGEEAPEAYKDVESVALDLAEAGVVEVVGKYVPRVTYKVRKEK